MNLFCVIFPVLVLFPMGSAEVINDPIKLRRIFYAEVKIRKLLDSLHDFEGSDLQQEIDRYKKESQIVLDSLENYTLLTDWREILSLDKRERDEIVEATFVGNALHVLKMCQRCLGSLSPLLERLSQAQGNRNTLRALGAIQRSTVWPHQDDLHFAMLAVARIQYTYELEISDLSRGVIGDRATGVSLSAGDCLAIARGRLEARPQLIRDTAGVARPRPEWAVAILWLEAALELSAKEGSKELLESIKQLLGHSRKQHDLTFTPPSFGNGPSVYPNEHFFISKIGTDPNRTGRQLRRKEAEDFSQRFDGVMGDEYIHKGMHSIRDYMKLCRGESLNLRQHKFSEQQCYLDDENEPFLKLQPLKVEKSRGRKLDVWTFHEILTDAEINFFKDTLEQEQSLDEAKVIDVKSLQEKVSSERTQSSSWLNEELHPKLKAISKKLERISGLKIENEPLLEPMASEDYQVGAYGPGGMFICHYDYLRNKTNEWELNFQGESAWIGNRVTTIMFYLSVVDGGKTAFNHAGVSASPSKGSVVVWDNLAGDGSNHPFSMHCGCPVLYGVKWIVNKWVKEGAQMFHRPCAALHLT